MIKELVSVEERVGPGILIRRIEYRSGIYTHTDEQLRVAKEVTDQVQKDHFTPKGKTIVSEIQPAGTWYGAEVC